MRYSQLSPVAAYRAALFSPIARLDDAPTWGKLTAVVVAAVEWIVGLPFVQLLLLLAVVGLADYLLGAEIAKRAGRYDPNIARAGWIGKASGVLLALILWALEAVIANAGLVDTHGMLATALAVVLLAVELESYDQHRQTLTGKPTPLLSAILEFLRGVAEGALPRGGKRAGGGGS